jgi:MEDS: MEthanogen/methylotroph, DcmR Sensory domain
MSNIVPFPVLGARVPGSGGHLVARFLERPPAGAHAVQFYDDRDFLVDTVARFLEHGLARGESALVIATAERSDALIGRLGKANVASALAQRRLVLADADAMLGRFMVGGQPSETAFASVLTHLLRELPAAAEGHPVRAFGEMVNRLWQEGLSAAAVRLEELWCRACDERLSLLCAYAMGNFYKQHDCQQFDQVCRLHSHVLPTERFASVGATDFDSLRQISLLEQRERLLENEVFYREQLEGALREMAERGAPAERALEAALLRARDERAVHRSELRAAARALLEPSNELVACARALASRATPPPSHALGRLNEASERLQRALARLLGASEPREQPPSSGLTNDH